MTHYTAKMKYSEETLYKLTEMQYSTFQPDKKLIILCTAVAFLFIGFTIGLSSVVGIVLLLIGSILLTGKNVRPRSTAGAFIRQLNGKYPSFTYDFADEEFSVKEEGKPVKYTSLICLIDDSKYLYLYTTPEKAYMVDSSTVRGTNQIDGLKDFISERSGFEWDTGFSLFALNYKKIRKILGRIRLRREYVKGIR